MSYRSTTSTSDGKSSTANLAVQPVFIPVPKEISTKNLKVSLELKKKLFYISYKQGNK
jgi:hypothetical protein